MAGRMRNCSLSHTVWKSRYKDMYQKKNSIIEHSLTEQFDSSNEYKYAIGVWKANA
jgi:hypothetical protein